MRSISDGFMESLKSRGGVLNPIMERVKRDDTIMLAIRKGYINLYYRGGNLLEIKEARVGVYKTWFDKNYDKSGSAVPNLPGTIRSRVEAEEWVRAFSSLKEVMDLFLTKDPKPEREYQQLVVRVNNNSKLANESEYFISDIEVSDADLGARFDMTAIRWRASERKDGKRCRAAFMEMKYGDDALEGDSGLLKHLSDFRSLVDDRRKYASILKMMESQFNQLDELGLLRFNRTKRGTTVTLDSKDNPDLILVLANHNPRKSKLGSILCSKRIRGSRTKTAALT